MQTHTRSTTLDDVSCATASLQQAFTHTYCHYKIAEHSWMTRGWMNLIILCLRRALISVLYKRLVVMVSSTLQVKAFLFIHLVNAKDTAVLDLPLIIDRSF